MSDGNARTGNPGGDSYSDPTWTRNAEAKVSDREKALEAMRLALEAQINAEAAAMVLEAERRGRAVQTIATVSDPVPVLDALLGMEGATVRFVCDESGKFAEDCPVRRHYGDTYHPCAQHWVTLLPGDLRGGG